MNFSTLALSAGLTLVSLNAFSVNNIEFHKANNDIETKACYTAATEGLKAAKKLVRASRINYIELSSTLKCNGMSIRDFASKYATLGETSQTAKNVKVIAVSAMDRKVESKLCVDAVTMGERAARVKYKMRDDHIECNGQDITHFLKSLDDMKVVKADSEAENLASL